MGRWQPAADPRPPKSLSLLSPLSLSHPTLIVTCFSHSRDYAIACVNEAAMMREARQGKVPTIALPKPRLTTDSWYKMWHRHLHWKNWALYRNGNSQGVRYPI